MHKFIYSGFADEISTSLNEQIKCLKELDMEYLELRGVDGINVADFTDEKMAEIMRELKKNRIKVSSIGSPVGKYSITEDFNVQLEKFRRIIEIAKIAETNYIRIFSYFVKQEEWELYRDEIIKRIREFTKISEKEDIILLHENEKDIFGENAENCKCILDCVNSPNLRAVFDPANFVQCGVDTLKAFEILKDDVIYMHIKDALPDGTVVPSGYGAGNIREILAELSRMGYEGFVSLEPHLGSFAGLSNLEKGEIKMESVSSADKFKFAHSKLKEIIDSL